MNGHEQVNELRDTFAEEVELAKDLALVKVELLDLRLLGEPLLLQQVPGTQHRP